MSLDAMKQALEAWQTSVYGSESHHKAMLFAMTNIGAAIEQAEKQAPTKLWLWQNFVGGRPEYWAFDNPFPCMSVGGDPLTLGEPCGWALLKSSVNGRPDRSEQEVINTVTRLAAPPQQEKQEPTPAMIQALTEQYDSDRAMGIGFNPQTLCRAVMAVQRQPLTDEQIGALRQQYGVTSDGRGIKEFTYVLDFARAIEAEHGITGEKK